jgi:hypothetical protein
MPSRARLLPLVLAPLLATAASGQSFNVDFGGTETPPSTSYGAAGLPGAWNAIGVLPPFERLSLVGLDGLPTDARLYMFGGTSLLSVDEAATTGDDEALMDDMLTGLCDPVDVCIWVENLAPGDYEVITYGRTPGDPAWICPLRVDFSTTGPVNVGGAWPGGHAETVTFARHEVTPTNQKIGLHSGTYGGYVQAGINGIQIRKVEPVGVAGPGAVSVIRGVTPNPAATDQGIDFVLARPATAGALEIFDVAGGVVRRESLAGRGAGPHRISWDGRDLDGHRVAAGLFFVRLALDGADEPSTRTTRLVRLR